MLSVKKIGMLNSIGGYWLVLHFDLNALREIPILVIAAQRPIQPSRLSF